ncbi:MAG: sigma-70 family RNA polymerase sigma factor [Alphaproteobacteria bacterium]|nr:sigma-70 family RNA polymerase sigma factor [Alphaproteobacteria bacterium]
MSSAAIPADLPAVSIPRNSVRAELGRYLAEIQRFPMLSVEEERELGRAWRDRQDVEAAHRLVTSHLRLVVKMAWKYRGYGLPMPDLIAEGNIGLMHAVKRFDPERGVRLSTYAMWWIKAAIQEFVLSSWSMVTIGTAVARKKLLFSLNSVKRKLGIDGDKRLTQADVTKIAKATQLGEKDVIEIEVAARGAVVPIDAPVRTGDGETMASDIADPDADVEGHILDDDERRWQRKLVDRALATLDPREQEIVRARNLRDEPETLEDLSKRFGVSRERVRQLEERALAKLQARTRELAREAEPALA